MQRVALERKSNEKIWNSDDLNRDGKEDKMLSYIYGTLAFICMIMAVGFAEGGSLILGLVFVGLVWVFYRLSAYEAGMIRKKKNSPR